MSTWAEWDDLEDGILKNAVDLAAIPLGVWSLLHWARGVAALRAARIAGFEACSRLWMRLDEAGL